MTELTESAKALLTHLRSGQQCDEDGVMCVVSRQACHEAADLIEAMSARIERQQSALMQDISDGCQVQDAFEKVETLSARVRDLEKVTTELAEAEPEWHSGRHPEDPQLDMPDLVDAATFYALQDDARAALSQEADDG